MSIIPDFSQLWAAYKAKRKRSNQEAMERLVSQVINVTEFDGSLWIAYNDTPIVQVKNLSTTIEETIADSRKNYLAWKIKYNI